MAEDENRRRRLSLFGATVRDPEINDKERFIRENTAVTPLPLCPGNLAAPCHGDHVPVGGDRGGLGGARDCHHPTGRSVGRAARDCHAISSTRHRWWRASGILDFASGSGAAAIAAALSRAESVTAVEIDPFSATAIALNAGLNAVDIEIWIEDIVGRRLDLDREMHWDIVLGR